MVKIGFVLPSSHYLFNPFKGDPHTQLFLLTILEDHFKDRMELLLIDLRKIDRDFAIFHIPECDIYLHSVYTLDYYEQVSLVKQLKNHYPKAVHIAGGPHANEFLEECLETFDSIVIGEGEEIIIQAVNDFQNSQLQRIYKPMRVIDINKYPYSKRYFLPKSSVARRKVMTLKNQEGYEKLLATTVMFARGCPYSCCFCAIQQVRKDAPGVRYRTPEWIEAEVEYLKKEYGMQGIVIDDEIGIPPKKEDAIRRLEALGRTNIIWRGQCRVDGITPELAALAGQSGCIAMGLGVESVNQLSLNIIKKQIKVEQSKKTIKILKDNGIEARIYLIIGLPGEPDNIVDLTWSFIEETNPDLVFLSLFTIRPGTEAFRNPGKFGIKKVSTDWEKTMHMYGRYEEERPDLTFEYCEQTPWGKGMSNETIIKNYLDLQNRLGERGLKSIR